MNTYINTLSLLLSYVHFSMPSGVIRTGKYKRIEGLSFIEVAVFETKTFRYIPFCISYCDDVIQCNSVAWDGQTGSCQLSGADITHERNVHELMNSSIGWTAAVKIRYKGIVRICLDVYHALSHNNLCFQCNIAITNFSCLRHA